MSKEKAPLTRDEFETLTCNLYADDDAEELDAEDVGTCLSNLFANILWRHGETLADVVRRVAPVKLLAYVYKDPASWAKEAAEDLAETIAERFNEDTGSGDGIGNPDEPARACDDPALLAELAAVIAVRVIDAHMADPLRWTKPRRIFPNSMSDLFHANLSNDTIDEVVAVMAATLKVGRGHTYQPLTKRAERLPDYWNRLSVDRLQEAWRRLEGRRLIPKQFVGLSLLDVTLPLANVWQGVTIEGQDQLMRALWLMEANVAVRWASVEPMVAEVDATRLELVKPEGFRPGAWLNVLDGHVRGPDEYVEASLDWVVVGAESGAGARPTDLAWVRKVVADCAAAKVPVFVKQLNAAKLGDVLDDLADFPEDLRIRQFPAVSP